MQDCDKLSPTLVMIVVRSRMAQSYDNMVWSGSLWGGGGIDMGWLDGMTGCGGDCNIDSQSVTFSNFKLLDEGGEASANIIRDNMKCLLASLLCVSLSLLADFKVSHLCKTYISLCEAVR